MKAQNTRKLIITSNDSANIKKVSQIQSAGRGHVVPAKIVEDEFNSQVDSYFTPNIQPHENCEGYLRAALLGHQLVGKPVPTPQLFDSYVMREDNQIKISLLRKVDQVIDWRKDRPWGVTDGPINNVQKWIDIQATLHQI